VEGGTRVEALDKDLEYQEQKFYSNFISLAKKRRKKLKVIMEMLPEECRFEVLKFAFNASYRDIICLYNDVNRGCPVNLRWRTAHLNERTRLLEYRVPEVTMALFYDRCKKLNLDPYEAFVKLLNWIVSDNKFEAYLKISNALLHTLPITNNNEKDV
jgi:hypothetical protein